MLIFRGKKRTLVPDPLPLAYSLYAFINVDNCERPLSIVIFPCGLEMLMFSSCNTKFFAARHIHYPDNTSSDHCVSDAVVPPSDHCHTETVLPPSDHYCTETVAPSGDHCCINIVVPSSDHCCIETVPPSSDHYSTTKVAPPSDHGSHDMEANYSRESQNQNNHTSGRLGRPVNFFRQFHAYVHSIIPHQHM